MTRFPKILTVTLSLIAALIAALTLTGIISSPSTSRPKSVRVVKSSSTILSGSYASDPESFGEQAVTNFYAGIARQERADADALAKERAGAGVVQEPARAPAYGAGDPVPNPAPAPATTPTSGDCANPVVPEYVAMRESGCRWDAVNPGGCSGRSCVGFYQLDLGHFYAVSPWNPNVSGSCYGLDWHDPAQQTECASRLGPGAWG